MVSVQFARMMNTGRRAGKPGQHHRLRSAMWWLVCSSHGLKNSLIADGCVIEGTVENSIIFRGVKIGRNATVRNSIIMQDSIIGEGASLDCVITDKNAVITDKRRLSGADIQPYYISKGKKI